VPVANLGTRVDQMAEEFRYVKESVTDMTARMGKLQTQIVDLGNAVKIMQAPPPPPGAETPPPGLSAETLLNNARRDRLGGNLDLALQEYEDYLRYFGNTDLAPEVQYNIGEIYYNKGDLDSALKAFDMVLEKYPDNNKTEDALYMKGMTLLKSGQRTAAAQEFREQLKRFPSGQLAAKAKAELKKLGYSAPTTRKRRR
jgi:TolA-binding protein